jgi:hypothetical protein
MAIQFLRIPPFHCPTADLQVMKSDGESNQMTQMGTDKEQGREGFHPGRQPYYAVHQNHLPLSVFIGHLWLKKFLFSLRHSFSSNPRLAKAGNPWFLGSREIFSSPCHGCLFCGPFSESGGAA